MKSLTVWQKHEIKGRLCRRSGLLWRGTMNIVPFVFFFLCFISVLLFFLLWCSVFRFPPSVTPGLGHQLYPQLSSLRLMILGVFKDPIFKLFILLPFSFLPCFTVCSCWSLLLNLSTSGLISCILGPEMSLHLSNYWGKLWAAFQGKQNVKIANVVENKTIFFSL